MSRVGDRAGTKSSWRRGLRKQYGIQAVRNFKAGRKVGRHAQTQKG